MVLDILDEDLFILFLLIIWFRYEFRYRQGPRFCGKQDSSRLPKGGSDYPAPINYYRIIWYQSIQLRKVKNPDFFFFGEICWFLNVQILIQNYFFKSLCKLNKMFLHVRFGLQACSFPLSCDKIKFSYSVLKET